MGRQEDQNRLIAPDYSGTALGKDNEPTFVGVLRKYFYENGEYDPICKDWNAATRLAYIFDYEKRIIPFLPSMKPLKDFEGDDFENALLKLGESNKKYSYSRLMHFRFLMMRVYKAALDNCLFDDRIFWREDDLSDDADSPGAIQRKRKTTMIKKSFSVEEEFRMLDWFKSLEPETAMGEEIGLAIMFFQATRNNETCGLNFGDLRLISKSHPFPCIYVTKTTRINSSELKAGGKTSNSPRILPTFDFLFDFIKKRRDSIQRGIDSGEIELSENYRNLDDLPIVCKGINYCQRSSSSDLSAAGKNLFSRLSLIGILKNPSFQENLFRIRIEHVDIEEKDPTTYLFRRNCGTHLYGLGLSSSEIQYFIGHEVEEQGERRNFFANENLLYQMYCNLKTHPYYQFFFGLESRDNDEGFIHFDFNNEGEAYRLRILGNEALEGITIQKKDKEAGCIIEVTSSEDFLQEGLSRKVNARAKINSVYGDKRRRRNGSE